MRYLKPSYYDEFHCIADKCPDTCCAGWQIMIDEDTLEQYGKEKGEFSARLKAGINWQEGCFNQCGSRCAMLNEYNLCDLILELGEECLCETCRRYPRHVEEFEGVREWSLSLSCPPAAYLILESETPMDFIEEENDEPDPLEEEFEEFDYMLFTQLEDARAVIFDIIRALPPEAGMQLLLQMAADMQKCLEEDRIYDLETVIGSYEDSLEKKLKKTETVEWDEENRYRLLKEQFAVFFEMERLRASWSDVIEDAKRTLFNDYESYRQIKNDFTEEYVNVGNHRTEWQRFQKNILVFFIYTYFCGAVYDDWIDTKVALAVFSVRFICEFVMCKWYLADKHIDWHDCVEMAYRFAREVEHSDENLNMLEEWLKGTEI